MFHSPMVAVQVSTDTVHVSSSATELWNTISKALKRLFTCETNIYGTLGESSVLHCWILLFVAITGSKATDPIIF